jgi:hypothetical protein
MIQAPDVVDTTNPEAVFKHAMVGAAEAVWELIDDEHRVDDQVLSALHDIIKRNEMRREAFGDQLRYDSESDPHTGGPAPIVK